MPKRVPFFDLLRSVAAFAVVLGHLRNLFFCDYSSSQVAPLFKAFYFLSGFGHQAVIIFFVLSGILIGQKVLIEFKSNRWSWKTYLFDRMTRLWIVLLPALVFTFILDKLGMSLFPDSTIYGGDRLGGNVISSPIQTSLRVFFGNALFLQQIIVPTAGSNGALWSLSNEFWYYLIFPVVVQGIRNLEVRRTLNLPLICGALLVAWLIRIHFFEGFLIWAMGCLTLTSFSKIKKESISHVWFWISVLIFAGVLLISRFYQSQWNDLALGVVSSLLCFSFVTYSSKASPRDQQVWSFFSNFSFSLYLTHLPLLVFLRAAFVKGSTRWNLDLRHFLFALLILFVCYFWAWLFSVFTEKKTQFLKSQLRGFSQKLKTAPFLPS